MGLPARDLDDASRLARSAVNPPGASGVRTSKGEPNEGAQRLIGKLAASGQLKAGFLLRVLQQGQIDLFDLGFAQLLELPLEDFRLYFYQRDPSAVALACRAIGIDRCVFPTVFKLSRYARGLSVALTLDDNARAMATFDKFGKSDASIRFRTH